jgi:putative DNA primase/helicase
MGDPAGPLVLYGLPDLASATRVYLTEGEKAADLARNLGLIVTTSAHGAKSAHKADWIPLAGRDVVILPDHDPEGEGYAKAVLGCLARLHPRPRVRIVRLADLWQTAEPMPEGGDIEEWLADGVSEAWEPEQCRAELERVADEAPPVDLDAQAEPEPKAEPAGATIGSNGPRNPDPFATNCARSQSWNPG